MKLVIAIIKPHMLDEVLDQLYAEEINLVTASEVMGHGRQKGITESYRGVKEHSNLLRKIRLEIAVNDDFVEKAIAAIERGGKTGELGDGKIFVVNLEECIRIRTGERGGEAIG